MEQADASPNPSRTPHVCVRGDEAAQAQAPALDGGAALDSLPGFRRRLVVTPRPGVVTAELEDDFHCMRVVVRHRDGVAWAVEGAVLRAPWTTCPAAPAQLERTFAGVALGDFAGRGEKAANCTHLHDLATLAAAHATDQAPLVYAVLVCDPVAGRRRAELRRDGRRRFAWTLEGHRLVEPVAAAGLELRDIRPLLATLGPADREAARILRWAAMIADGRTIPMAQQSDAARLPPNCFTLQPDRARVARRVGRSVDFSRGPEAPLQGRSHAVQDYR